ncbi:MAG: M48 family metalloprotease [Planctomycetes bacterium]|nr:M48 family metalloprotease [Planctomycetota bacterium]
MPPTPVRDEPTDDVVYTATQKQILAGLHERLEATPTTLTYRLALLAVAAVNLLLPVLYLALIFLVAYAVYWNWRYNGSDRAGGWILHFALYPLGLVTLIFLIKPLFARDPRESAPLKLKRTAEPFLFEYVGAICQIVGAPTPSSIRLVCEPNASASLSGGLWGVITGRMDLTIGLPLVTGMTARQLTGILAHEFGHFAQQGGMRLSFIVRHINWWLVKIVFLRDAWDEKLSELGQARDPRLIVFVWGLQFCIFLTRQLLFGLVWMGNAISFYLLRQMEFDADLYEARLVGHRVFTSSFTRMMELGIAHHMSMNDLGSFHSEGRLPDNLPALIAANIKRITPELRKEFLKLQLSQKTELFDSHPSDRERIDRARGAGAVGVFQIAGDQPDPPARCLFTHLDRLCCGITVDYYKKMLGREFKKSLVHPVGELIRRRDAEFAAGKALDRYFQVHVPIERPLPLDQDAAKPPAKPAEAARDLQEARERMLGALAEYKALPERYDQAESVKFATSAALMVLDAELKYRGADFNLPDNRHETARGYHKRAVGAVQHLAGRMLVFETAASERLTLALRLLQVPKVAGAIPQGDLLQTECQSLIADGRLISEMIGELPELQSLFRGISALLSRMNDNNAPRIIDQVVGSLSRMTDQLQQIHDQLDGRRYAFDHADGKMTLQQFVIPQVPEAMDLSGIVSACELLTERLFTLQVRIFSRLAQAAEKVEQVLGMPPLPEPVDDKTGDGGATASPARTKDAPVANRR